MNYEIAWAAGFYDGEGTCTFHTGHRPGNGRGYSAFSFKVAQKDVRPLLRFRDAVGAGRVYGPYSRNGLCPLYWWSATREAEVRAVIEKLWPYLSEPKREQITGALALREERREATRLLRSARMREMNAARDDDLRVLRPAAKRRAA